MKLIASFVAGLLVMAIASVAFGAGDSTTQTFGAETTDDAVISGGAFDQDGSGSNDAGSDTTLASPEVEEQAESEPVSQFSDLPPIAPADLPLEALDTLALIASDGPYPFNKDDSTFQNREGFLPDFPIGHYREYTVVTPGENDRGARRIVSGADGELYYTSDHYASFSEIVLGS